MENLFFKKKNNLKINDILNCLNLKKIKKNIKVNDIKELDKANQNDITFIHSLKYKESLKRTKSKLLITNKKLKNIIPKHINIIEVQNVLLSISKVTSLFYPNAIDDMFDKNVKILNKNKFVNLKLGQNILVGKNVKIGKNCVIGHNTIIEKNVIVGDNCSIGSNSIIRNTILKNHIKVLDGCVIGKKGFGFFPNNGNNYRFPQIGIVLINDYSEIGCGSTIDRGSISNTVIGRNTYLDNQIHIAHNVRIGDNCIIAGQVGFAGSSILGNNVMIGGQAGISGHLNIGNNIKIGGGSGVVKDIPDNSRVMGYPAKDLKEFIKENK